MALVLHEFDGIPHAEIAKIMRCSEGTVRSRLHYARLRMQEKLKKFL
jgi:RNA polymerase sigma-70 factor (ECF subfamily)